MKTLDTEDPFAFLQGCYMDPLPQRPPQSSTSSTSLRPACAISAMILHGRLKGSPDIMKGTISWPCSVIQTAARTRNPDLNLIAILSMLFVIVARVILVLVS